MLSDIEIATPTSYGPSRWSPRMSWGSTRSTWCLTVTTRRRSTSATSSPSRNGPRQADLDGGDVPDAGGRGQDDDHGRAG